MKDTHIEASKKGIANLTFYIYVGKHPYERHLIEKKEKIYLINCINRL